MNDDLLSRDLNELLALETRGLLRFLDGAAPYLTAETYKIWAGLRQMAAATSSHARRLTEILESLKLPVRPASFQTAMANYHYATLTSMLPLLVAETRRQVTVYEQAVAHASDRRLIADALGSMLSGKRWQLAQMENYLKVAGAPVVPG